MVRVHPLMDSSEWHSWAEKQYCKKYQKPINRIEYEECKGPRCLGYNCIRNRDPNCKHFWADRNV